MMIFGYGNGTICGIAIIALVLIILLVYEALKENRDGVDNNKQNGKKDAMNILDRRLASGEISEEEYKKRKKILDD